PSKVAQEIEDLIGIEQEKIILASAKEGVGIDDLLRAIVERVPPPHGHPDAPTRALIFDSHYDPYKGVIAYVRVVDGALRLDKPLLLMAGQQRVDALELGAFRPRMTALNELVAGEVGYIATGLKSVREVTVGDTVTTADNPATEQLPGYRPAKPMVFAGMYPVDSEQYYELRDALEKLKLNDASLVYEPESSVALGFGFRCGFLGLLHLEIVQERLEREYDLNLLVTAPSVEYNVLKRNGDLILVDNPADLPPPGDIEAIEEPWMKLSIFTPAEYIGTVMELVRHRRGTLEKMEYLDETRVHMSFEMPLAELIVDFYDQLKSRTRGYASLDYHFAQNQVQDLVKMDILVNEQPVDALSLIVHRDKAQEKGSALAAKLKEVIPRQMFAVPIQAAIGGRIIARETVRAMSKNVLAKCYGGDITRKRKLLEKQKEGKKRMKRLGNVEIPQEAFMAVLKLEE
ncbi:MAG: translation elongation factor 4, partial [Anaerolineae bacterium]|nr:translation elongation factor 4 [Anaerolineae bacterium]